jgi:endonuclease YncB( thermonuclease family)
LLRRLSMPRRILPASSAALSIGLLVALPRSSEAEAPITFTPSAVEVVDGDTLDLTWQARRIRVHLEGADCPEAAQPFGREAALFARELIGAGALRVTLRGSTPAGDRLA